MTPLLEMRSIHKSFYGVKVLQDVPLTLYKGEVLALLGENGAGKSTLIKILNGDYQMDAGSIFLEGQQVNFNEPRDAEKNGIVMIYQELHYAPDLSVAENLFIGKLPSSGLWVDWQRVREEAKKALGLLNIDLDPDTLMRDLTVVERQIVEIVKAIYADAKLLVMDEPTAALTPPEVEMLFATVQKLRQKGVGIIYISHRLDEIFRIAQRVTVLRDGKHVATKPIHEVTPGNLVEMMVGREIEARKVRAVTASKVALEVSHLSKVGVFEDINFKVHEGEVVSIFGLLGSGQANLTRCIFGAEGFDSGGIKVYGEPKNIRRPQDGKNAGIGFVPIDRKVRGLVLGMSVRKNLTLSNWAKLSILSFFQGLKERQHTKTWIDALGIRMAGGMDVPVRFLSGGNQQKVVLARWLEANVKILILNEPTWGVDVGARSDIYDQLEILAKQGLAILVVSSDIQEVLAISHRILTIYKGRLTAEFSHEMANEEQILTAAAGGPIMKRFHERIAQKARDVAASPVLIVAFGDSVTQGYTKANTIEPKYVYHQCLKEQLEIQYPLTTFSVINAGVAGFTAQGSLERLQRDVIRHQPDLVLIGFGLNDAVVLGVTGLEQFGYSLQTMIDRIRAETESDFILLTPNFMVTSDNPNIHVTEHHYLAGLLPIQTKGVLAGYAEAIRKVAVNNNLQVADVYQSWSDLATNGTDTNTLLANGLNHPTAEAQKIPAELLFQCILKAEDGVRL